MEVAQARLQEQNLLNQDAGFGRATYPGKAMPTKDGTFGNLRAESIQMTC